MVVPSAQSARLGTRARVPIRGTANGRPFRSSLLPDGRGGFTLVINGPLRSAVGVKKGDWVRVIAEVDSAPRTVRAPRDFRSALEEDPAVRDAFRRLSYSHRKAFVEWIREAKQPGTRSARVARSIEMIRKRQSPKG